MEITSAEFVISNTDIPRIRLHRTFQRWKIQPHQHADGA